MDPSTTAARNRADGSADPRRTTVDATTIGTRTIRTTIRPTFGRTILAALALALLAAILAAQAAGATPNDGRYQKTHQQRAGDFADGCKSAGGTPEVLESNSPSDTTHVRCDFGEYAVSCVFHDGFQDTSDACADSRGRTVAAGGRAAVPTEDGAATTEGSGDAGGSTPHAGTRAAPTGGQTVLAVDDRP
jgi:hypothetical protein